MNNCMNSISVKNLFQLFVCLIIVVTFPGCATVKGSHSVKSLEFVDHGYERMTIFGLSARTASSLLNENITAESLRQSPEFTIRSNEIAYIGRIILLLKEAKSKSDCAIGERLLWMIELESSGEKINFTSDGEVILGPNGFCKSAVGLKSFDVLR